MVNLIALVPPDLNQVPFKVTFLTKHAILTFCSSDVTLSITFPSFEIRSVGQSLVIKMPRLWVESLYGPCTTEMDFTL